MRKFLLCAVCVFLLCGCASYKFQHGASPYDAGYVAYRDNYPVVEYTVGPANTVPAELDLAKERFKRRRKMVEYYQKQLGTIENRFKQTFGNHITLMAKLVTGVVRLPVIAVNDYRYAHDAFYRARVRLAQQQADLREEAQTKKILDALADYIAKDLENENPLLGKSVTVEAAQEKPHAAQEVAQLEHAVVETKSALQQVEVAASDTVQEPEAAQAKARDVKPAKKEKKPKPVAVKPQKQAVAKESASSAGAVKAMIAARPAQGYSPLTVHFSAAGSRSSAGRIIAYTWDFGDGDTSTKKNPVNTFWSASFEPRQFTVTLTVNDDKGNAATVTREIEVLNK